MNDHTARLVRHFLATPEQVFDAWATPELVPRWYSPNPALTVEFHGTVSPGAEYRVVLGGSHEARGVYRVVERPHALEFSWRWVSDPETAESTVRIDIDTTPDGVARLRLQHSGLASAADADSHAEGWDLSLNRLVALLAR